MILSGYFELSWWAYIVVALLLTHITIASVTIYLHRHQTHHALDIHPIASHVFRFWLWLTTGMLTREWVAIHRKHHARCESAEDPHSPQILGIARVLWGGVFLYVRESRNADTIDRFGRGTPDDWIERNVYGRCPSLSSAVTSSAGASRLKRRMSRTMARNEGRSRLRRWAKSVLSVVPLYSRPLASSRTEKLMRLSCDSTPSSRSSATKFG